MVRVKTASFDGASYGRSCQRRQKNRDTAVAEQRACLFQHDEGDLILWGFACRPNVKIPGAEANIDPIFLRTDCSETKVLCMMTNVVAVVQLLLEKRLDVKICPVLESHCPVTAIDLNSCVFSGWLSQSHRLGKRFCIEHGSAALGRFVCVVMAQG